MAKIGILGGSGLYKIEGIQKIEEMSLMTPFGEPSCNFVTGELEGTEVVFLPRHGKYHTISPSEINYRANIYGMKKLGVDAILSVSACGSLKEEINPLDFVIPDQFFDRTQGRRADSFFGTGLVAHVAFADPVSPEISQILLESCREAGAKVHSGGTYICIEGPQFSTKAESRVYRSWGMDIIGMTNVTEAKLAREAGISYATLAAVTDFDCWHPDHGSVTVEMIIANLTNNVDTAKRILKIAIPKAGALTTFSAADALRSAIVTAKEHMHETPKRQAEILLGSQ